jgi:protein involved in polysaccharide export with SLBB domain
MKKIFLLILAFTFVNVVYSQDLNSISSSKADLAKASLIGVTVGGSFIINGTFPASMNERADQFITRIFTEAKAQALAGAKDDRLMTKIKNEFESYAKRGIILKRFSGEIIKLDLEKFRLTGDFKFNPYLKNDDVIIFPEVDLNTNFIDVIGAVNKEVKFQFVDGDNLSDALLFAGGINPAYENVKTAEISRLNSSGDKEEIIPVDVNSNFPLRRGDRIRIPSDVSYKKDFKALVLGEVKKPGYIYITKNQTTVRDLINKAGGFSEKASLERSELIRGINSSQVLKVNALQKEYEKNPNLSINNFQKEFNAKNMEDMLMLRMADISTEDSLSFLIDNNLRMFQSNGIIDFTKILNSDSNEGSFIVKDRDVVVVPLKEELIYVFGQVNNPGYTYYQPGKDYKHYIKVAGGLGESADDDVKIIKGRTRSWITAEEKVVIDPGDFVYVPKDLPKKFDYYIRQIGSVSSIFAALATLVLVIIQSGK